MSCCHKIAWVLMVTMGLLGCSSQVELTYYILEYDQPPAQKSPTHDKTIAVEKFKSSGSITRNEVMFRNEKHREISLSSEQLWWSMPDEMITEYVVHYFIREKVFTNTFYYPTTHRVDYTLEGHLHRLEIRTQENSEQWQVYLEMHVYLVGSEGQIVWDSGILAQEVGCAPEMAKAVRAMEKGLQQIMQRMVKGISPAIKSQENG